MVTYLTGGTNRTLIYGMSPPTPLMNYFPANEDDVQILHKGEKLKNPHLAELTLQLRGRRDITSADWDADQPLTLDVGVPILAVLNSTSQPPVRPIPRLSVNDTALIVGPGLIAKDQKITFTLLVDNDNPRLTLKTHLQDVKIFRRVHIVFYIEPQTALKLGIIISIAITAATFLVLQGLKIPAAILLTAIIYMGVILVTVTTLREWRRIKHESNPY